jgi:hypothetical protein
MEGDRRLRTALRRFTPGARADLLRALTSPPDVRAERIRLCFERPDTRDLGELLIDLEEDDFVRAEVVDTLRGMDS